jgi:hypothetical protein
MAPRKPSRARLIPAPSLPPRVIHIARQLREAAESMAADPSIASHEKRRLLSAIDDLGAPLEELADKIKDDPYSDVALWLALGAAFLIGNHVPNNPSVEQIKREMERASAAHARQAREPNSNKTKGIVRYYVVPYLKSQLSAGEIARKILEPVNRERDKFKMRALKKNTLEKNYVRPLLKSRISNRNPK